MKKNLLLKGKVTVSTSVCGVITDAAGREFYFGIDQCIEGITPELHSIVTFYRDGDYKLTLVATEVKPTAIEAVA